MFTGIIEEVGTLRSVRRGAHSAVLTIGASRVLSDLKIGDSVAVNGVCLTATTALLPMSCMKPSIAPPWGPWDPGAR